MSRVKNDEDLLLRVRQDEISRLKNGRDLILLHLLSDRESPSSAVL